MEIMKERIKDKELSTIKTLGEAGIEGTTSEWVKKIKPLQDEKEKAEKGHIFWMKWMKSLELASSFTVLFKSISKRVLQLKIKNS